MKPNFTKEDVNTMVGCFRADYTNFYTRALGLKEEYIWDGMRQIAASVRDHQKTCVYSGHSLSKDFGCARLSLAFLYSHGPRCTVVITGPANNQVENIFMREVGDAYNNAIITLNGKMLTQKLEIDKKWFLIGFTTNPDDTGEATRFQGFHNEELLVIFTEAAGVEHRIWKAAEHLIISPQHRWLVYGNATSATGDFAECNSDPTWHKITLSVLDSPNYKAGREIIPGVSGRPYVERMKLKYGENSDDYRVRVLGQISRKPTPGSYYGETLQWMEKMGRIGDIPYHPGLLVHTVCDPGYTSAWWFFQVAESGYFNILRYYEDEGRDMDYYARLLMQYKELYGYNYGKHFAPVDTDNNQYKIVAGDGLLEIARKAGLILTVLPFEKSVELGIERTRQFLKMCRFHKTDCEPGLSKLKAYHQKINQKMTTETNIVYGIGPEKDGNDHSADGMRYMSMCAPLIGSEGGVSLPSNIRRAS